MKPADSTSNMQKKSYT